VGEPERKIVGYPLASSTWAEEEIAAMQSVIATGRYTMGERVAEFERAFADYTGSRYCVMCNSGSSANLLMIAALRYRKQRPLLPGEEVIVPAVSWSTTYSPLHQYGIHLRFVDIDSRTLNFDLDELEGALTDRTRAVFAVNLLGNPNEFARIRQITEGRSILLLEDNCESLGAIYRGQQAGTFGIMGSFSGFFSHHISTMEGGMVVTDDEELYHILLCMRAHGWTRNLPKHNQVCGTKSDDPFEESFRFVLPGYNLRPLELSGAVGVEQLKKLPQMIRVRRENAEKFLALMREFPWLRPQTEIGHSSWFGFSMVVEPDAPVSRAGLINVLGRRAIDVRPVVAGNFAKNEVMSLFEHRVHGTLDDADEIDRQGFFVGNHHFPLDRELALLREALTEAALKG